MSWEKCEELYEKTVHQVQRSRTLIERSRLCLDATSLLIQDLENPRIHLESPGCRGEVKLVQNPRTLLGRYNAELWMYLAPNGDHQMTGWYFYYVRGADERTQLWGPFANCQQAEICAITYYYIMPLRWKRCGG